jgi:hypothetical protein
MGSATWEVYVAGNAVAQRGPLWDSTAALPGFIFLRTTEVRLAPEHRAQYLTIREVVKWEITDETGDYSGFLIAGEQIIGIHPPPQGFVPSANLTFAWQRQERT